MRQPPGQSLKADTKIDETPTRVLRRRVLRSSLKPQIVCESSLEIQDNYENPRSRF